MSARDNEDFVDKLKARLDEGTERLDAHVLSRLNQARQAALQERRSGRLHVAWRWAPPAALAAAVAVAVIVVRSPDPGTDTRIARADDLEIMLAEEDLEMLEDLELLEDLEFFESIDFSGDVG